MLYLIVKLNIRALTPDSNPAHPPKSSGQVPRLLLDLIRHESHIPDSHLTINKFKPPPYPGFFLTALVRTRPHHMQRPKEEKSRERHPFPFECKFSCHVDVPQHERHSGADTRDHVFNDASGARE